MKTALSAVLTVAFILSGQHFAHPTELDEVTSFPNQQVTGVAVSASGRVFVNFPNWSAEHALSVAELVSWGPGGNLYVTASQIENMPRLNQGLSTRTTPYKVHKATGLPR